METRETFPTAWQHPTLNITALRSTPDCLGEVSSTVLTDLWRHDRRISAVGFITCTRYMLSV